MKARVISILLAMVVVAIYSIPSSAQTPNFSICSDQNGAASGLCRAGVAVGCDEDDSSNACALIAEQFENVTGEPPPYAQVSLSPANGIAGVCYWITDLQAGLVLGDMVWFHLDGDEPIYGESSIIFSVSSTSLLGRVP